MSSSVVYSAAAGLCAAGASVFAKVAFSDLSQTTRNVCISVADSALCEAYDSQVSLGIRGVGLACMILSNVLMTTCFAKAMQRASSFTATVTTTSFNFSFTALFSMVFFGETLPPVWWAGFSCILMGLALLTKGQSVTEHDKQA